MSDSQYCLLIGDFNSRTGKLNEYVETDILLLTEFRLDKLEEEYANELRL